MSRNPYNSRYGHRPFNNWGDGDIPAPYAEGDIVLIPPFCRALESGRVEQGPGVYRVISGFSIDKGPSWYFRVVRMEPSGRGDRWRLTPGWCSNRLHVIPGRCDYTAGWVLLFTADPEGEAEWSQGRDAHAAGVPECEPNATDPACRSEAWGTQ